jgi:hypothetical protein
MRGAGFLAQAHPARTREPSAHFFVAAKRHLTFREHIMSHISRSRIAELHNLAAHAHTAAAVAHDKGDHLTAHELTKQAHEHSMNAHKASEELVQEHGNSSKPKARIQT